MKSLVIIIAALALSACAIQRCSHIYIVGYSSAFEKELAAEILAAPTGAVWPEAILDYRHTRDALKACQ
jgi:hypothetical protein